MRKLGLRGRRQVLRFEQREYQKIKLEKVGLQWDLQSKYNLKKMLSWDKKKQDVDVGQLGVGGGGVGYQESIRRSRILPWAGLLPHGMMCTWVHFKNL